MPVLLASCGVGLVISEGRRGGTLDGAVTVLPDGTSVIEWTTCGDRFDRPLFTLLHECAHLVLGHVKADATTTIIEDDVTDEPVDATERAANTQASSWLFLDGLQLDSTTVPSTAAGTEHQVQPNAVRRVKRDRGSSRVPRSRVPRSRVSKVRTVRAELRLLT